MMIYKIGVIEDIKAEASEMMLVLNKYAEKKLDDNSYIWYDLTPKTTLRQELFERITEEIENNFIQCLIVDYRLDRLNGILEGIDIVEHFHNLVPEFPVIILTNVPKDGKMNDLADPDKVYAKKDFLNPNEALAKEMVFNIIRNMERYSKERAKLELKRDELLTRTMETKYEGSVYDDLIRTERLLAKYTPVVMNRMDEEYSRTEMKDALKILKEYKELLD